MDLYAQNILDHYKNPVNKGKLKSASVTHKEANHSCGDTLEVDLKVSDGKVDDVKFRGEGCAISQAAMSILSEELIGMTEKEILKLREQDIHDMLGIPVTARRRKCALLSLLTTQNALRKKHKEKLEKWMDLIEE